MAEDQKYFLDPWAVDGDRAAVPDAAPIDGSVSYDSGWGTKYQQDPATTGLNIPRDQFNQVMFDVTQALQIVQKHGFPYWITTAANGGSPFPYDQNATVRHNGVNYYSLVDANTDEPPSANWGVVLYNTQSFLPGDVVENYSSTLPAGWLWADGKTIGSAASGSSARANADTVNLFTTLWNSVSNAALPILSSVGAPVARGVSAAADFAANKRMPLPDRRGKAAFCADNLGGAAAGILTGNTAQGVNGAILCATGGEQSHTPVLGEMFSHTHALANNTVQGTFIGANDYLVANETALGSGVAYFLAGTALFPNVGKVGEQGSSQPFNEIPPAIIANFRIKL